MSPAQRRDKLVDATLELLREHGRSVTTRQIAEAAGVAEGTIFRVVESKEELVDAAIERAFEPGAVVDRIEEIDPSLPLEDRLVLLVSILQQRFLATFGLMRKVGLVRPPDHLHDSPEAVAWRARLVHLLGEVVGEDSDRLAVDTEQFVHTLRLLTFAGSHTHISDGHLLSPEQIVGTVLHGLLRQHDGDSEGHDESRDESTRGGRAMLIRILRTHLAPYKRWLAAIVVLQFTGTVAMLYLPSLNADIIDRGIALGDTDYIVRVGVVMLAVSLLQIVCAVISVACASRTAMSFGRDLRGALFHRIGSFSGREIAQFGAPSLITRNTNDVQQVQMLALLTCSLAVQVPIMMVGGIVMAMREDLGLSWLLAVVVPALFVAVGVVVSQMVPSFRLVQSRIDDVNRILREQISGIRVVRAFVREPRETERFAEANDGLTEVSIRAGRWMATMFPLVMLVVNVSSVAVIWFGGHRVDNGQMQVGALTAFLTYLMQILMSVMMGTFMLMQIPRSAVCADRIAEVLDTRSSVVPPPQGVTALDRPGHLDLEDVSFTYPGAEQPVLCGVDLSARPGQMVAIIGSTGAGKSTLVNLVPRLFDATSGVVRVDGVDIRDIEPEALWSRIGLIPQKAFLFTGTIRSNLLHGRPEATDDELWHALDVAQAKDFVERMPEGLDAPIVQGGTNVSGGQRQRLAIARALVRRPGIYLFDDAFSALDLTTDARLRAALRPETRDATVVVVAQRVSTIRDADLILVLEDGRVIGRGTHDELLASDPTYQEIVASQLTAEEAA